MLENEEHVFVVDDDAAVRDSLQEFLGELGYRVATFASAPLFLARYQRQDRACLIVDLCMPQMSGLELQEQLRQREDWLPCVFLTAHGDVPVAVQALKKGAADFLEKPCNPNELLSVVRRVFSECSHQASVRQQEQQARERIGSLTPDERAVLHGLISGLSNVQIAERQGLSLRTIQFRRASLVAKLGVRTRAEFVALVKASGGLIMSPELNP